MGGACGCRAAVYHHGSGRERQSGDAVADGAPEFWGDSTTGAGSGGVLRPRGVGYGVYLS
jgi:hypothetical protein